MEINLKDSHYEIVLQRGSLQQAGAWLQGLFKPKKIAVISDSHVFPLYGPALCDQIQQAGFEVSHYIIPAGEASKTLRQAEAVYEFLADQQFTRSDVLLALGGGVVGDLTGFVASTYMRGLSFVQVPTSLLAQVDSSIGGKTAVNSSRAKNLIGTFAQPAGVLIDPETLATLSKPLIEEGIAEIIKCALIKDRQLWEQLKACENSAELLKHAELFIAAALAVKKWAVEADEYDQGTRLLLNFGHTIGHALENTLGYGTLSHGEAVSIGMVQITKIAEKKGLTPVGTAKQIQELVTKFQLPVDFKSNSAELYQAITHDKKTRGQEIKLVVIDQIGTGKIVSVPLTNIPEWLERR